MGSLQYIVFPTANLNEIIDLDNPIFKKHEEDN